MQTKPANWAALFNASHKTEYKFVINGVDYTGSNISGTPTISKPLLDKPALGRVCTGSLSLTVLTEGMAAIPKAAQVDAYCRLRAASGGTVTDWLQQGSYYITSRSGGSTLKLTCLDGMIKAGTTYRDKSAFIEWPQTMTAVVNEIASIMGVSIDPRTVIITGADYKVSYPNDDMLISEVLGMIAAAHGGNWIMTETGKLRLITFSGASDTAQQILGKTHTGYKSRGKSKKISRVILSDNAGNDFTAGDDTGATLAVKCDYATQGIAVALCNNAGGYLTNSCLYLINTDIQNGLINLSYGTASGGLLILADGSLLYGTIYEPYSVDGAYIDPALELGDTISVTDKNNIAHKVILQSVKVNCTSAYTCGLTANTDEETEDEYPYYTAAELSISRAVRTDQTYFGNRLTRAEGFVSELLVNGEAKARMTANASVFAMQTREGGTWADRIYFDTLTNKYVITADVTVNGAVTFNDLSTRGSSVINGDNITTGTIAAARVDLSSYSNTEQVTAQINTIVDGMQMLVSTAVDGGQTNSTITLKNGTTTITSAIVRGTTAEQAATIAADAAHGITLSVVNGTTSSTFSLKAGETELSSGTIKFTGVVTFNDLKANSATIINGDYITTGTIQANRVNLSSYSTTTEITNMIDGLTLTTSTTEQDSQTVSTINLSRGTTSITNAIVRGTTATQAASIAADAVSGISLSVVNGSTSSTFTLTADSVTLSTGTISFSGIVTFTALSTAGMTEINGGNITTGAINATLITTGTLNASLIKTGTLNCSYITVSNLSASSITTGDLSASRISGGTLNCTYITVTNLSASSITTGNLSASRISGGTLNCSYITVSNLDASSITTGNLSASRISGGTLNCTYITVSNLSASSITSGNLNASRISGGTLNCSSITVSNLSASSITSGTLNCSNVTVSNLSASSITSGTINASTVTINNINATNITTGTIDCSKITVKNINASNITTGKLSADLIDTTTIRVQYVYAYQSSYQIAIKSVGTSTMYIGGDGSWNFDTVYLYADSYIRVKKYSWSESYDLLFDIYGQSLRPAGTSGSWALGSSSYPFTNLYVKTAYFTGSTSYGILVNTSRELRPTTTSTYYPCYLGTSSYPWHYAYLGSVSALVGTSTGSKVGFFGTTPISRESITTVPTSATVSTVASKLNELIGYLKNYGLLA